MKKIIMALREIDPKTQEAGLILGAVGLYDETTGLRIVLDDYGIDRPEDTRHNLLIERQPGRWAIYIHANGGDPVLVVEIADHVMTVSDSAGGSLAEFPVEPVT